MKNYWVTLTFGLAALLVGYLGGRWHVRYEQHQDIQAVNGKVPNYHVLRDKKE